MAKKKTAEYETYIASAKPSARMRGAAAAQAQSAFKIEVRFLGGLTTAQKNASRRPPTGGRTSLSATCRACSWTAR
jgi:hypothetical protein